MLLVLRVILSWIKIPQYQWVYWLCRVTDPVIEFFRKNFPIRFGLFDISIIIPIIILNIIGMLVNDFMISDKYPIGVIFNIWYIFQILIIFVKLIFNFILVIYIIFTLILLIFKLISQNVQNPNVQNPAIDSMYSLLNPILKTAEDIFKIKSVHREIIYLVILLVAFILINGFGSFILDYLKSICVINLNIFIKEAL